MLISRLHPIRDTQPMSLLAALNRFRSPFHKAVEGTCVGERDVVDQRIASTNDFPDLSCWHPVRYPGALSLPLFLLPVVPPMPEKLQAAGVALHEAMRGDGIAEAQYRIGSRHEKRQSHLWFADIERRSFQLIGQMVFSSEERRVPSPEPAAAPGEPGVLRLVIPVEAGRSLVSRWWLHHAWLSPAYRGQRVFSHSIDYMNEWHPGFQVRDPAAALAGALKDHPEHIFEPFPEKA